MQAKSKIKSVVKVFETGVLGGDYGCVSVYDDGTNPETGIQDFFQITYGSSQTTEQSHLATLLNDYTLNGGQYADEMTPYLPHVNQSLGGGTYLSHNSEFIALLKKAGDDPIMQQTQDELFERVYFEPAQRWANQNGFLLPLSMLVVYDSFVHSGKMRDDIRNMFREKTPAFGGNEKRWILSYVTSRRQWLRSRQNPILRKTVYRMDCFLAQIAQNNWQLTKPVKANGIEIM